MSLAPGQEEQQRLQAAGFSGTEIGDWRAKTADSLTSAGFSGKEVGEYFGDSPQAPLKGVQTFIENNLKAANSKPTDVPESPIPQGPQGPSIPSAKPKVAEGMLDAIEAGWQMSTTGLISRGKLPDTILPDHAEMAMRIASQASALIGDVPAMVAGGVFGGVAGSEVPFVGNVVGAGAGAFAAPAALRSAYIAHLQKGDVKDFSDFWERTMGASWEALKGGVTGALTEMSGGLAAPVLGVGGKMAAQLATMTTVGKALEGEVPKPQDFLDGAILLAGLHGTVALATELPNYAKHLETKLQDIYSKTGVKPEQAVIEAQTNPVLRQELLSSDKAIPQSMNSMVEKAQPGQEVIGSPGAELVKANIPKELLTHSDVLGKGFASEGEYKVEKPEAPAAGGTPPEPPSTPEEKVLDRIGEQPKAPPQTWSQIYTRALDALNPIKQVRDAILEDGKIPVGEDPYALMRLAGAANGKAEVFIEHGPLDFKTLEPTGAPGLREIIEPFKNDLQGLRAYAISARALELANRGVQTGIPLEEARQVVEAGKSKYQAGFRKLVDFQNGTLKYLKDAGILSKEGYKQILDENQNYIPFNRVMDEVSQGSGKSPTNPIKEIYGSDRKLIDPIESVIRNTYAYMKIAERNRAMNALVTLAGKTELGGEFVKKVETTLKPMEVSPYELKRYFRENGIHEVDPEAMTIWRPLAQPLGKDEIAVMRNGKREVYNVGEDVAKAFNAVGYQPNIIMKAIATPAKMLRTGAVETVDFLARHFMRDQTNAFVLSNNGYVPVYDAIRGMKEWFTDGKAYQEWLAGGGGMSTMVSLDRDYIQSKIFELSKQTGLIDKTMNILKHPLDIMQAAAEVVTSAPRIGEFMRAKEAGKDVQTAAYEARSVTLDNQRMGSDPAVKAMSLITAFWNTHVQGVDRLVQAFKERPLETTTRMGLAVTLPSVLLWMNNKDDPRYGDLPRWEKDLFWIVLTPNHVFRIPKPFEQGILFGSSVERMLDAFYKKNPDAFKGFGQAVVGGAFPNTIPSAFMPMLEQFANRSWLTGGNIVPHSLEKVAPAYQYNAYTSETAKVLGKMINFVPGIRDVGHGNVTLASPMVIQNYVRAWTGGMGMYALQMADKALTAAGVATPPPAPTSTLADSPFIKAFVVRYPGANSQHIQDFYDNLQATQTAHDTATHLAQTGNPKAWGDYMASPEAQENMVSLQGISKTLSAQNRMIQLIYSNTETKPDEKRQTIDGLYMQMIQSAAMGNKLMEEMKKARKEAAH